MSLAGLMKKGVEWVRKERVGIALILLFVAMRMMIVLFFVDSAWGSNDAQIGCIAKEVMTGLRMHLFDYAPEEYAVGRVVYALCLIPFYVVFGAHIISNKIFIIGVSAAILGLWYVFLKRYFSQRIAVMFSVLYIFASSVFVNGNLFVWMTHFHQVCLPAVMILLLWYRHWYVKPCGMWLYVASGLISGIALWFDYLFMSVIVSLLVCWFIQDKLFFVRKQFLVFVMCLVIGLSVRFGQNIANHGQFFYSDEAIGSAHLLVPFDQIASKVYNVFCLLLPHFFYFVGAPAYIYYGYCVIFALLFCVLMWWNKKYIACMLKALVWGRVDMGKIPKEVFILVLMCVHLVMLCSSAMAAKVRYVSIVFPYACFVIAYVIDRLRVWKYVFLIPLVLIIVVGSGYDMKARMPYYGFLRGFRYSGCSNYEDFGDALIMRGYDIRNIGPFVGGRNSADTTAILYGYLTESEEALAQYKDITRTFDVDTDTLNTLRQRFKMWIPRHLKKGDSHDTIMEMVIVGMIHDHFLLSDLTDTGLDFDKFSASDIGSLQDIFTRYQFTRDEQQTVYECLGVVFGDRHNALTVAQTADAIPAQFRESFFIGIGFSLEKFTDSYLPTIVDNVYLVFDGLFASVEEYRMFDPRDKACVYMGYMMNERMLNLFDTEDDYYLLTIDYGTVLHLIETTVEKFYRPYFYRGIAGSLGMSVSCYSIPYERALLFVERMPAQYRAVAREELFRQMRFMHKESIGWKSRGL